MRGLSCFILSILIRVTSGTSTVTGFIGQNVTLPCMYDTKIYGVLSFCWGRGILPSNKCSSTILSSQDGALLLRNSPRYQLLGQVTDGDVSLTILSAQKDDDGVYGCRVEIPGWFNDYKVNIKLIMVEAPVEQLVTQSGTISTGGTKAPTEMLTTFAPENLDVHTKMDCLQTVITEGYFKGLLTVGNIGRMALLFFLSIIIIFTFIFRRICLMKGALQHHNTLTAENIYESIPMA